MAERDKNFLQRAVPGRGVAIWNILTALVLLAVICIGGMFLMVFLNPYNPINPFPPPPPLPAAEIIQPTASPTEVFPPTWTPTSTPEPTFTETPHPTGTLPPSATPFPNVLTGTAVTTLPSASSGGMPFVPQGDPVAVRNIYHSDLGCNWMGVSGQVEDQNGSPIQGQQVQLGGFLPGISRTGGLTLTGLVPQLGPGFYEFKLADEPVASNGTLWVQLLSQEGIPLTQKIYFQTFEDCDRNLIILDFQKVR